jgi:hypothetical protein
VCGENVIPLRSNFTWLHHWGNHWSSTFDSIRLVFRHRFRSRVKRDFRCVVRMGIECLGCPQNRSLKNGQHHKSRASRERTARSTAKTRGQTSQGARRGRKRPSDLWPADSTRAWVGRLKGRGRAKEKNRLSEKTNSCLDGSEPRAGTGELAGRNKERVHPESPRSDGLDLPS